MIAHDGIRPDPKWTEALSNFPIPTSQSNVRSFLGLANQLASFVPDFAHSTSCLRQLRPHGKRQRRYRSIKDGDMRI